VVIVDSSCVVFGSGNMDRASWYTSQELSIGMYSCKLAEEVSALLKKQLDGRTKTRFGENA
jgi:phosphatidylserine/phosphatidylglycerophosphate/cardiolipin synthase-like enzyme